jgi:hypothetical protein
VYNLILKAVKGDKATADAIFEDYLAGNYPKNYCQFRGVGSARIKQAHQTVRSRGTGRRDN